MKRVYTQENRLIVGNAKNILELAGFTVSVRNEFAAGGMGELAPGETWMELWVNEQDYETACDLLESALSAEDGADWQCLTCDENNDASFEICWQCQESRESRKVRENKPTV